MCWPVRGAHHLCYHARCCRRCRPVMHWVLTLSRVDALGTLRTHVLNPSAILRGVSIVQRLPKGQAKLRLRDATSRSGHRGAHSICLPISIHCPSICVDLQISRHSPFGTTGSPSVYRGPSKRVWNDALILGIQGSKYHPISKYLGRTLDGFEPFSL